MVCEVRPYHNNAVSGTEQGKDIAVILSQTPKESEEERYKCAKKTYSNQNM